MSINNVQDVSQVVRNFKEYVESKDEKQQGLVDAVLISNLNSQGNHIQVTSFDFNLNSQTSIKEIQSYLTKKIKSNKI